MAKKSKTQRAKASAARAEKKEQAKLADEQVVEVVAPEPEKKSGLFKKKAEAPKASTAKTSPSASKPAQKAKKVEEKKPKKERFKFFKEVKAELKRVTWPSRKDVLRWSGVVVAALLFFGIYVALLDNVIITPALVALSGLGA